MRPQYISEKGEAAEFRWGKFDKKRQSDAIYSEEPRKFQATQSDQPFVFDFRAQFVENPETQRMAKQYPNLTQAYLEAVGVKQYIPDPMSAHESTNAIVDFTDILLSDRWRRQREDEQREFEARMAAPVLPDQEDSWDAEEDAMMDDAHNERMAQIAADAAQRRQIEQNRAREQMEFDNDRQEGLDEMRRQAAANPPRLVRRGNLFGDE